MQWHVELQEAFPLLIISLKALGSPVRKMSRRISRAQDHVDRSNRVRSKLCNLPNAQITLKSEIKGAM